MSELPANLHLILINIKITFFYENEADMDTFKNNKALRVNIPWLNDTFVNIRHNYILRRGIQNNIFLMES